MIHFQPMPIAWINAGWADCEKFLNTSFHRKLQGYTMNDAKADCLTGRWQLWAAHDDKKIIGAVLTNVTPENPQVLNIMNMGGERLAQWQEIAQKALEDFAKKTGCKAIRAIMRKGLTRLLKDAEEDGTIYIKFLE